MKKIILILTLLVSNIFFGQEDARLPAMKKVAKEAAVIILDTHAEILGDEYSSFVFEKYITGADFNLKNVVKVIYFKVELGDKGIPVNQKLGEEILNVSNFEGQIKGHLNSIASKHFKYNLERSLTSRVSGKTTVTGEVATNKTDAKDDKILFNSTKSYKWKKHSLDGERFFTILVNSTLTSNTFIRTDQEQIKKIEFQVPNERQINGAELTYKRLGPGFNQTDIEQSVLINANKNDDALKDVVTGDYQTSLDNVFCGCNYGNIEDKVIDTRSSKKYDEHIFILKEMVLTTVTGQVFEDKEFTTPLKNAELTLKPSCEDADNCMFEVENVKTDSEGVFEFKNVPKGGYTLYYKDQEVGEVKNCNFQETELDAGEFYIASKYDIVVTYTAPSFAKSQLLWANTTIRFPEEGKPVQKFDMIAFRNSGNYDAPTGTDGKPFTIPYATVIPGIGLQTLYGWPENESTIPEVIFVASLGGYKVFNKFRIALEEDALNTCNISQDNNGPIYLDLNFDLVGKYSNSAVWQQVDVGCLDDKEWNITKGNSLNGYPLAFKRIKFTEAEIDKFKKSEEFERILSNGKATLKIEFKISKK